MNEYERGRADAVKEAMREDIHLLNNRVAHLESSMGELRGAFDSYVAAASAAREALREAAQKAVTTKQFAIGVTTVIVAFIGLFIGAKP